MPRKKSALDADIGQFFVEEAVAKLPPISRGHVRLFRAANRNGIARGTGAHLSPDLKTAKAYLDNPGFGGSRLYAYDVPDEYALKLYAKQSNDRTALLRLASELDIGDPDEVVEGWLGRGLKRIYQVLENDSKALAAAQKHYDWISYQDDFPAYAETWRYLGDQSLKGVLLGS